MKEDYAPMLISKGDLVTLEPQSLEDVISGQQYFSKIINREMFLGVVTHLNGRQAEVRWLRHPTHTNKTMSLRSILLRKIVDGY